MPDQGQRLDTIKSRMQNRDQQRDTNAGGGTTPQTTPEPEPAQVPQAQAPTEPARAPEPNPESEALKNEIAQLREQLTAANEAGQKRQEELQAIIAAAQEKAKLPSVEELDSMSQGEAVRKAAEAMMAQVSQQFQGFKGDLERDVLKPTRETISKVELGHKRAAALEAYPGTDMNKYGKAFDDMLAANPRLTPAQALKAVADPRDLSSAPQQPTNPAPSVPNGAHMEQGVSGRSTAARNQASSERAPTTAEQLAHSHELRQAGDRFAADEVRRSALKDRLTAQGKLRAGA
jgi:hypothetical protein